MSDPEIFNKLDKFNIALIGTSFKNPETFLTEIYDIHPKLFINNCGATLLLECSITLS
jgi:hypothetical protein